MMSRKNTSRFVRTILSLNVLITGIQGEWIGRKCCEYAIENECRMACLKSKTKENLNLNCRQDVETELYGCIFRHQRKKKCCGKSSNMTTSCQHVCVMSFRSEFGPSAENMRDMENHCPADVLQCTKNFSIAIRKSTASGVVCCDKSNSEKCRSDCRRIMRSYMTEQEKVDELVESCGSLIPREPMWKCFISNNGETARPAPPRVGPDLQCCSKAISSNCRQLCKKLYSKPWESSHNWQYFQKWCEYNSEESDLNSCLQEVREPCKMGCNKLNFCTNFNNRPTELFHSCNARADNIAKSQFSEWAKGTIKLPMADIPVLDIRTCEPEKWKAVACTLEVKPCSAKLGDTTICKKDCMALLRECADVSRFKHGISIEWLCEMFSPQHLQHDCISLDKYTAASGRSSNLVEITQPCNPNPCQENELCVVNRETCRTGRICPTYKCLKGCKVGDVGDFLVHIGQRVKIPDWKRGEGCFRACACTSAERLQHCTDLPCLDASKSCTVVGQIKVHGSHFKIDCNFCSCYNGNVTCTKRQCASKDETDDNNREFTGLPCNCERHFVPVCASNGKTYPSACIARCMGHVDADIDFGPCRAKDPCKGHPCRRNEKCVRASRVCITSSKVYDCPQYECVAPYGRCLARRMTRDAYASDGHYYVNYRRMNSASRRSLASPMFFGYDVDWNGSDPVCDTDGVEYDNICQLRKRNRNTRLAYRGHCKKHCDDKETVPVCGQNIVTYENECSALAERVLVDYYTPCHAVNVNRDKKKTDACAGVICKELADSNCESVTPPGACCPRCGGMIRIVYSQLHVNAISRTAIQGPITVRDIIRSLRRHVNVKQCDIYGHLTMEGDIAVLSVPVVKNATPIQIEACLREAEGLARFINERNPILTSDVILSTLTGAEVHGKKSAGSGAGSRVRFKFSVVPALKRLLDKTHFDSNQFNEDSVDEKPLLTWIMGIYTIHYIFHKLAYSAG
ncbi:reversion-inducing cysteine-rich protein with Kazal motifs-like [Styela clava]